MRIVHHPAHANRSAQTLIIMLPGAMQQPEHFIEAGFADAVRGRQLSIDLALVDLGLQFIGETTNGEALARLHRECMQSTLLDGYRDIWLAGISIGGFMALAYEVLHSGTVQGLCLLAPYPGNRILANEIRSAGGLSQWNAVCSDDDMECRVWQWLKRRHTGGHELSSPRVYCGIGNQDRFASGQQLMAAALPAQEIDCIDGVHDWPAWQQLWNNFLDRQMPSAAPYPHRPSA